MSVTLNVYVKDATSGSGVGTARVIALTKNQIIDPPTRQTSGDGGANLYFEGPPFTPPIAVSLAVDAPGYAPWSTNDQPIMLGSDPVNYVVNLQPFKQPFTPAPRAWKGNMCGVRVPGAPAVAGGAADPSLILSWFYDRYDAKWRGKIRDTWRARGITHVLTSWADARVFGHSASQFAAFQAELISEGFFPCPWLTSKAYDPPDVDQLLAIIQPLVPLLTNVLPMACLGGELNLWLSPDQLADFRDRCCPIWTPGGTRMYVHFSEGYSAWQPDGHPFAYFWNASIGKLTGVLHQKILAQDPQAYYYASGGLVDILIRFAGNAGCSPESGFGHPFDLVAMEITAQDQFNGTCTEAQGDALGDWAMACPAQGGPAGMVGVMGSGNGGTFR
jgi:hypothetical protein